MSYSIVTGTSIGYVYMIDCSDQTGNELYGAVKSLIEDSFATSILFDLRTNYGGSFNAFLKTFKYLAAANTSWVGYGERVSPTDRFTMINSPASMYNVIDNDPNSVTLPVAILCGPNAVSAGDFFQILYKKLPVVKTFGKSTAAAFGARSSITVPFANYYASKQAANFYEASDPTKYLTHYEYPVDEIVWLEKDSVCNEQDNVVNEAIRWINSFNTKVTTPVSQKFECYPNPADEILHVSVNVHTSSLTSITVSNITGAKLQSQERIFEPGINTIDLSLQGYTNGIYFISIKSREGSFTEKILIQR